MTTRTITITANAYRASEAQTAIRTELRKRGVSGFRITEVVRNEDERPDDKVAIVVTTSSDGRPVSSALRRTYRATVLIPAGTDA